MWNRSVRSLRTVDPDATWRWTGHETSVHAASIGARISTTASGRRAPRPISSSSPLDAPRIPGPVADPISVNDIKQIINHLRKRGIGVLITDHNVRDTLDICEKAFIVGEGHIIASGTADDVMNNARVRRIYLGDQFQL